ncbi:hypothetical protein [Clostridium oryzae]|uniref:hypothetical protein n=1 Tax=Clostridium oryzae TaxID=1450648 RepID=UPI003119A0BB
MIAKPIEMVAWFTLDGIPHPVRFRFQDEQGGNRVIKIDRVINRDKEKVAGNEMINFRCESVIKGIQKVFEIKYELRTCRWVLFKI